MSESPLISRADAMAHLGTDSKGLVAVMLAYKIEPDSLTGALPREKIYDIARQIAQRITYENASDLGQKPTEMGGKRGAGNVAQVVP